MDPNFGLNLIESVYFSMDYYVYRCAKCGRRLGTNKPANGWVCGDINQATGDECESCLFIRVNEPIRETYTAEEMDLWRQLEGETLSLGNNATHNETIEVKIPLKFWYKKTKEPKRNYKKQSPYNKKKR